MTAIPTGSPPSPASTSPPPRRRAQGAALRRAWRECMIPIAARDTAAVGALRGVARSALTWWKVPVQTRADVLITLSELATNALVHTDGPLRVRLTYRSGTVRLDVADSSHVHAQARTPDLNADTPGGWGLTIAEALADRLTVTDDNTGPGKITTVEFRIKQ